ncbi:MAG TPA: PilZ domain-containing protein [Bryobacteraceae bacterium]|nr:PilZ domain-containing protein [Bryobacteraceae bacterium]
MEWLKRAFRKLLGAGDRRRCSRREAPLVALFWTGGQARPARVASISADGAFVHSGNQWAEGTVIDLLLQPVSTAREDRNRLSTIALQAIVVRRNSEGMGLQFLFSDKRESKYFEQFLKTAESEMQ